MVTGTLANRTADTEDTAEQPLPHFFARSSGATILQTIRKGYTE
jgi:hypothetical protein